jgi:lipoprotein NlpD
MVLLGCVIGLTGAVAPSLLSLATQQRLLPGAVLTPESLPTTDGMPAIASAECPDAGQAAGAANDCTTGAVEDMPRQASDTTAIPTPLAPDAPDPSPSPTSVVGPATLTSYVVQPGDSLRSIAERFKLTNETLIWANDLANPDLLRSGIELTIPPWTA